MTLKICHRGDREQEWEEERERERSICVNCEYVRSHAARHAVFAGAILYIFGIYVSHLSLICFRRLMNQTEWTLRSDTFILALLPRTVSSTGIRCLMGSFRILISSNPELNILLCRRLTKAHLLSLTKLNSEVNNSICIDSAPLIACAIKFDFN